MDGQAGSHPPPRKFAHEVTPNGLIMSTCLICQRSFASATPSDLRVAEAAHKCGGRKLAKAVKLDTESQFERKLCEQSGKTLIESHCKRCGHILLGAAVFGDLLEQEQHALKCGRD